MSNIDKQALREIAAAAVGAHERLSVMPPDDIFDISLAEGTQLDADITALNALNSAANPATVLALLDELETAKKRIAELEARTVKLPAAMEMDDDFDSAFEHGKAVGWNAYRAAMLQAEPVSNSDELPLDYLQGHKDGLEWAAQLAEANHPQTGDWLYDDPIDLARAIRKGPDMPTVQGGSSPVTPDGWISCSERMPDTKTAVLVAREFDRKGDWRMKWATYIPGHPDANDGWIIPGASWIPSHWMPLPEPPQEAK
ncbi:DUF551 domain-containing protein [Escherichia coli]|nr:DUF551 domain-containing protein [Escherichia coli]